MNLPRRLPNLAVALAALAAAAPLLADDHDEPAARSPVTDEWFPVHITSLGSDATAASPISLAAMNPDPAGSGGFLRPDGGRIVDADGGEVRLFGTNICDWHVMPDKADAPRIAQRLQELGINFIRLHYYDVAGERFITGSDDPSVIDPEKLDQMHFLVAELKAAGVYVDVNLHVARVYAGVPDGWTAPMGKGIDRILPELIEDQKAFARAVLLPKNPYTGLALIDDPAVAVIEINNENTLLQHTEKLTAVTGNAADVIAGKWTAFLRDRYADTDALRRAWNDGVDAGPGEELLADGDFSDHTLGPWDREASGGGQSTGAFAEEFGTRYYRWDVTEPGANVWNHQLHHPSVPVEHGKDYLIEVRYRATEPLTMHLMHQEEPWRLVSGSVTLPVTEGHGNRWETKLVSTGVHNPDGVPVRLSFDAVNRPGTFEFETVSVREGSLPGLAEGDGLEAGVPLPGGAANGRVLADFRAFALAEELASNREMVRFLKEDLGARSMILDTQVNYGDGAGVVREYATADAIDIHGYPAHPGEVTGPDGQRRWRVGHRSMIGEAASGLPWLALWRKQGAPFLVSEFDLNPPNQYASESYPLLALMASYQGWDGLGEYAWLNFQSELDPASMEHPYHTAGNPQQIAFIPASAVLFREGLVEPAGEGLVLRVGEADLLGADHSFPDLAALWQGHGVGERSAWQQRLAVVLEDGRSGTDLAGTPRPVDGGTLASDTGQIAIEGYGTDGAVLAVDAPRVKMAFGATEGRTFGFDGLTIEVLDGNGLHGDLLNVMAVSLDGEPIGQSKRLLLAAAGRVLPSTIAFHDDALTVSTTGPGGGPAVAEPFAFTITAPGVSVTPLDADGNPAGDPETGDTITLGDEQTLWWLVTRD